MTADTVSKEVKLESILEDFEPGDRVSWNGTRTFATVSKIEDDKLFLDIDWWMGDILEVGTAANGESFKNSTISQWRVFPNVNLLQTGDILSTTLSFYTGDSEAVIREYFVVDGIIPRKQVFIRNVIDPEYRVELAGDNFSRNLEDVICDWDLEG